ncbi:MAG: hypothetical protein IJS73_06495 [Paludibacteraceae bacterium]|nr:hypothetical protein [Paludibacteraceae bacterium]
MKKFQFIMLTILMVVAFVACKSKKSEEPVNEEPISVNDEILATVTVQESEETTYTQNGVKVKVQMSDFVENALDIYLYAVSFSEKMPVKLDVIIPSVSVDNQGLLSANNVIPMMMTPGGQQPVEKYLVTDLNGQLREQSGKIEGFSVSLKFGEYPTTIKME